MKVDKHISELLYENDCVTVPEFGGFVANYAPSKIHSSQHSFAPPSKSIIFNKNLKNNDGLLANRIATIEKTTYPEALKTISYFVSATNSQLKKGEKVTFEDLGILHLDNEHNVQFEQGTTNHLLDAFGLANFHSPAIKRDTIAKKIERAFKDREPIASDTSKLTRVRNIKRYVAIAIALPFIFGMIWIPLKTDLLKNIHSSSLNPFASKEVLSPEKIKATETKADVAPASVANTNDTLKVQLNLNESSVQPTTAALIENKTVVSVKTDSTNVSVKKTINNSNHEFHLITGCFQIRENADKFVIDLQHQNISASIIGMRGSLYVVSAGEYATRREAYSQLQQLRTTQPEAWLLKKEF